MALQVVYEGGKRLNLAQVNQLLVLVRKDYSRVDELWKAARHHAHLVNRELLPDLPKLADVRVDKLKTEGHLAVDEHWIGTFCDVIGRSEPLLGSHGWLMIDCYYTEKGSQPKEDRHDCCGLHLESGKCIFYDYSRGDDSYRRVVHYPDLIRILDLPLRIKDKKGNFFLERVGSGEADIGGGGPDGENPSMLNCQLARVQYADFMKKLEVFLAEHAVRRSSYEWRMLTLPNLKKELRHDVNIALYQSARKAKLPAKTYQIDLAYYLTSLDGISQVSSLLKNEEAFSVELCSFVSPEKTRYGLELLVNRGGIGLRVYSNKKADKKDFPSSQLGKKLAAWL
jgi:hypothetical protein